MAITSISRMQQRRGLRADLPISLSEGEFGWCLDTRQLFIGNSSGYGGNSEILTEHSANDLLITNTYKVGTDEISGAVARPLTDKLNDIASVKDFGAKGDGVTDDTAAINNAIATLLGNDSAITVDDVEKRIILHLPAGIYVISSSILLYPYLTLVGDGMSKSTIVVKNSYTDTCMMQTVDSSGNTGANIGLDGALTPRRIVISDLTLWTNSQAVDAVLLTRYSHVRFENVRFQGANTTSVHSAVKLQSIGTGYTSFDAQFVKCYFESFRTAIYADDPVQVTRIINCQFNQIYTAISIGAVAAFNGPRWTLVSHNSFTNISDYAVAVYSSNPGVTSSSNFYTNVGTVTAVPAILWNTGTTLNSSIGDIFNTTPAINNLGSTNISANAQTPLRIANLTTTQRNALTPSNGDMIYNTTTNRFQGYQNGGWINIDTGTPA